MSERFPTAKTFLFDTPLYTKFDVIDAKDIVEAKELQIGFKADAFCLNCGKESTFTVSLFRTIEGFPSFGTVSCIQATCARHTNHRGVYFVLSRSNSLMKIGQYPSLADIANDESKQYRQILQPSDAAEFHRAIGLAAHGVGIGSFVYLRRIIERLIGSCFEENKTAQGWPDEDFYRLRMAEKIGFLSGHIPDFLVDNKDVYRVLSKGLHELSEEECLAYFDVLKMAIVVILEEEQEKRKRAERKTVLTKAIAKVTSTDSAKAEGGGARRKDLKTGRS